MATWEQWMPELLLAAPTAPIPLVHLTLNRASRNLLRATRAWQEWLEPVEVNGDPHTEYSFELPSGAELVRLERATINGRPLELAQTRDLQADPWREARQGGAFLVSANLREFCVTGRAQGAVQVYVALMPTLKSSTVPDQIAGLYHEAIREGAKAELLNQPGTDYYQPDQAAVALAFFNRARDEHGTDVWRSNTGRVSRGHPRWL